MRSRVSRGADVSTLRGNAGADFESEAIVIRGRNGPSLFSWFDSMRSRKKKYILVKGPCVFVFSKATSSSPNFAIPLKHETVHVFDSRGKFQVVTLATGLGDVEYTFKFDLSENEYIGRIFGRVLRQQIVLGNCDEAKKQLGHHIDRSKSLKYAQTVAEEKVEKQPTNKADEILGIQDVPMFY